jgi:hypothetical protein
VRNTRGPSLSRGGRSLSFLNLVFGRGHASGSRSTFFIYKKSKPAFASADSSNYGSSVSVRTAALTPPHPLVSRKLVSQRTHLAPIGCHGVALHTAGLRAVVHGLARRHVWTRDRARRSRALRFAPFARLDHKIICLVETPTNHKYIPVLHYTITFLYIWCSRIFLQCTVQFYYTSHWHARGPRGKVITIQNNPLI